MRAFLAPLIIVAATLLAHPALADSSYHQHRGFFAAVGLGVAEANFDLETGNDEADVGMLLDLKLGYGFHDRWAVTVGIAPAVFSYEYSVGLGDLALSEGTRNLSFTMLDVSAWYLQPLYRDWLKAFVRAGLGATVVSDEFDGEELDSENSVGVVLSGGLETFFGKVFGLSGEFYLRTYGVTLQGMDDKEALTAGFVLNLVWR